MIGDYFDADTSVADADQVVYSFKHDTPPAKTAPLRRIPNIRNPSGALKSIRFADLIDVVILGDGYSNRTQFESHLEDWIEGFLAIDVYRMFAGAFRIRAIYHESGPVRGNLRSSYYRLKRSGTSLVSERPFFRRGTAKGKEFSDKVGADLDALGVNDQRYPSKLDVGSEKKSPIHNVIKKMLRNCVVSIMARRSNGKKFSGHTRLVKLGPNRFVNVAFGVGFLHEFGHAFALLEDEYIEVGGAPTDTPSIKARTTTRKNPRKRSVFTLSNLTFKAPERAGALWLHLSPWGRLPRSGESVVGWLWRGGEKELEVWHSEYHCLMNGTHDNYLMWTDRSDGTGIQSGAKLRSGTRFCLWCQEIATIRILEKTGELEQNSDPPNINLKGERWYARWVDRLRDNYWQLFNMDQTIRDRELIYANRAGFEFENLRSFDASLRVHQSDLVEPLRARKRSRGPAAVVGDGELLLMLEG